MLIKHNFGKLTFHIHKPVTGSASGFEIVREFIFVKILFDTPFRGANFFLC